MIKTKKTTLCVLLVAVLMFSTSMAVFAASPYETRYNNTVTASSSVSISDSGSMIFVLPHSNKKVLMKAHICLLSKRGKEGD